MSPCAHEGNLTICWAPAPRWAKLRRERCPVCKRSTGFLLYDRGEYYDPEAVCLRCGDRWAGEEMLPRPFAPRWRQESRASARATYRQVHPKR